MKTKMHTFFALIALVLSCTAMQAREIMYYVDVCNFFDGEGKPYFELYLDVDASTISYKPIAGSGFQGAIEIRLQVQKKDATDNTMVYEKSFELLSPVLSDTSGGHTRFGVMDVRRISLDPGEYVLTGYLKDKVPATASQHKFVRELLIEAQPKEALSLSEIEFIQSFTPTNTTQPHSKHGFDILPLVVNATFTEMDSIHFYLETYNSSLISEGVYFVNVFVTLANSTSRIKNLQKTMRQNSRPLDLIVSSFEVKELPSQTYYLNVEVYSKEQKLIGNTTKKFFVLNSRVANEVATSPAAFDEVYGLNEKELDYYLRSLYYISTNTERDFAAALKTPEEKKNYFHNFWENRKTATDSPHKAWLNYKARVDYANTHFKAAHLEGWRTDRGRVILTYGPPNDVERNPSSNSKHPYDVWRYNKIKTQSDVRFIFFNPNEATAEYMLLHCDLRGELNNPRWEFDVVRTANDANLDKDNFGGKWK